MKDLSKIKFGRLTVLNKDADRILPSGRRESMWLCKCDCGNIKSVRGASLVSGNTSSCGCLRREKSSSRMSARRTHGFGGTKIYKIWQSMLRRCEVESSKSFKNYGALGVRVCDEWHSVDVFCNWAISNGYLEGLTLERIDNQLGYCPDNCIWADRFVQNNHTSRNHTITFNGETLTMAQWSRRTGISYDAIKARLNKYGWSVEKALTTPCKR